MSTVPAIPDAVVSPWTFWGIPQFLYLPKILSDGIPFPPTAPTGDAPADRTYISAQAVAQRTTGQTLDAWAVNQMARVANNGSYVFNMLSLDPVGVDVERSLVEMLRHHARRFNIHARLRIVLDDKYELSDAMEKGIAELIGQSDRNISVDARSCDYRMGLPVDHLIGADIIYSFNLRQGTPQAPLAALVHDCLRPPCDDLPGGEALIFVDAPLARQLRRSFASLCALYNIDMVAVQPAGPDKFGVAHIKRRRAGPINDNLPLLVANSTARRWHGNSRLRFLAARAGMDDFLVAPSSSFLDGADRLFWIDKNALDALRAGMDAFSVAPFSEFLDGADRLFWINKIPLHALSIDGHAAAFLELLPDILGGMPTFTAASVAYGHPSVLGAVLAHGDAYPANIRSMVFPKSMEQII